MRAIIPVAGVGTRLRPHTYTLPKVLLNVAGKPILGHIIDAISTQGIDEITVVTGYMGKLVQEYVNIRHKIKAEFVPQRESLGLGHALWVARNTFNSEPIIIILGDTIFDMDLSLAYKCGFSAIGVKEVEDPRRFGVVELNSDDFVTEFIEKPEVPASKLAIVGIYFIQNTNLFKECLEELIRSNIKTKGEYQLTDALQLMLQKGEKFKTFPVEGWYDCGKPETLLSTNRYLLTKDDKNYSLQDAIVISPSFIAQNAIVERSIIGPYVTVAEGAVVSDSVVKNSIISDGATVTSSLLEESIIGNNAIVKGNFYHLNVGNSSEINF